MYVNYFDGLTKLFSDLYLVKFLNGSTKPFFPCANIYFHGRIRTRSRLRIIYLENEDEPFKYLFTQIASYGQGLKSSSNCHAAIIVAIVRQKEREREFRRRCRYRSFRNRRLKDCFYIMKRGFFL